MDASQSKHSISNLGTKTIEGGIRALVRGNGSKNVSVPGDDAMATGAAAVADIEKLMAELLVARDYLQAEGERVRRINANYAHLAHTASASVKIIAESIGKWRTPDQVSANATTMMVGREPPPALSPPGDGETQSEAAASQDRERMASQACPLSG
jgi:hypothetical protein